MFDASAVTNDGSVDSTVESNSNTSGINLQDQDRFGSSVANIGDLDGDGVNDLLVGNIGNDNGGPNRGAAHILFMNTDGTVKSAIKIKDATANGPTAGECSCDSDKVFNGNQCQACHSECLTCSA